MELKPWETTGVVVLQAESEISSVNMVYGGASTGKRVMTSSSSPGISLMSEGLSYLAGAELPCLVSTASAAARVWVRFSLRRATTSRPARAAATVTST